MTRQLVARLDGAVNSCAMPAVNEANTTVGVRGTNPTLLKKGKPVNKSSRQPAHSPLSMAQGTDSLVSWIAGLMRENYEAVGFLPYNSLQHQYIANERYVLQTDARGRRVGYLLHGAPQYGRTLNVAQHCIQDDYREHGHGERALEKLIERAQQEQCSGIGVRCATDLESLGFWLRQGFQLCDTVPGGERRNRWIARLFLPIRMPLFQEGHVDPVEVAA